MAARALIFDLDGTLWDSAGWFAAAIGHDHESIDKLRLKLLSGGNIVAAMSTAGLTRPRLLRVAQERSGPPPLFDGVGDAIIELKKQGTPLGVATSLPGTLALPMLDACGLSETFGAVIHAGVCRTPKPSPASLLMALRMLRLEPGEDIFYVGDRSVDLLAAKAAGLSFAWMRHGYEVPPETSRVILDHAGQLLEL